MSNRVCAVTCCKNNGYKLAKWNSKICDVHDKLRKHCDCPKPFDLFPFPTERKNQYGRRMWVKLIQRKNGDKNWQPKDDSRVCSVHFVDNAPTILNPYPTLHLGYSDAVQVKARPPPSKRCLIPEKSSKMKSQSSQLSCTIISENIHDISEQVSENNVPGNNFHDNINANLTIASTDDITDTCINDSITAIASSTNIFHKPICDHDYFTTCQGCSDKNGEI